MDLLVHIRVIISIGADVCDKMVQKKIVRAVLYHRLYKIVGQLATQVNVAKHFQLLLSLMALLGVV